MPVPLILLVGLHLAAGLFWFFWSALLGWGGNPGASRTLYRPQMIASVLAVFSGGGLWQLLHVGAYGRPEQVLSLGALAALAAAGVQGSMVGGSVRRIKAGEPAEGALIARIVKGQRIGAGLLAFTLATMIVERFV